MKTNLNDALVASSEEKSLTLPQKDLKILICIPAFNEEGNIGRTVSEIKSLNIPLSVVVINDGSLDKTALEAKKAKAHVISLPFNLGIGGAVQTGFKYAFNYDFDIMVQVDGDGQHDARYLAPLLAPIINQEVDMVIGSRFLPPHLGYQSSFARRIGIHFFMRLIQLFSRYTITDPTSGFRAYNKKMIRIFARNYPHDFPEPEAIVIARLYNARLKEIPVEMRKRLHGSSSIRYLRTLYYMMKVTLAIILDQLKGIKKDIG